MSNLTGGIERQHLSDVVEHRLMKAIIAGEFLPGERLKEPQLAARLGVSRAPIREALIGLEFSGLIETDERGYSVIPVMTEDDIYELYLLRCALEPTVARLAAGRMTPEIKAQIKVNIEQTKNSKSLQELASLDREFHQLIFQGAAMPRFLRFWNCIGHQIELWFNQMQSRFAEVYEESDMSKRTAKAHLELFELICNGDGAAAAQRSARHLQSWLRLFPGKCLDWAVVDQSDL